MKTRSKALYVYLLESGVLNGTPEQIAYAKQAYRKQYKRKWKQQKRPCKELRIEVTIRQFERIRNKAKEQGMKHTAFARNVILAATNGTDSVMQRDLLLHILQRVSMTFIELQKPHCSLLKISQLLEEAEQTLLKIIQTDTD